VKPELAIISTDLPGRVSAVRDAQIRTRVTGIVQKIVFKQGALVKEGEVLFKIDPVQYQATYDQAAAQLKKAQADAFAAKMLAQRYAPLVKANAVSKQDFDNAQAAAMQTEALVAAAKANLDSARINLGYTNVVSPIAGRIGKAIVTEGAFVDAASATQLATVQQLDPSYVDVNQTTAELARLRKLLSEGALERVAPDAAKVSIILEDGSVYAKPGKLLFTGVTVNESTGQVSLRTEVSNPDETLLPGMFVRVRIEQGITKQALLVPLQAIQRTPDGRTNVLVVKESKVSLAPVQVGASYQGRVIIASGLQPGDEVVVEGYQKVRPGMAVKVVPATKP
jgi:membrane fusion protein (multidrug efflux system)